MRLAYLIWTTGEDLVWLTAAEYVGETTTLKMILIVFIFTYWTV